MQSDNAEKECSVDQKRRGNKCCIPVVCKDEGFESCQNNKETDICSSCPEGEYVSGTYSTEHFESSPCELIQNCLPGEIRNRHGVCKCDRAKGYYPKSSGICYPALYDCDQVGQELNELGTCSSCNLGYFKDQSGPSLCRPKSNITCSAGTIILEGGPSKDRTCITDHHTRTTTVYPTVSNVPTITLVPNQPGGSHTGVIIGIVCGFILVVIVFIVIILWKRHARNSRAQKRTGQQHTDSATLHRVEMNALDEQGGDSTRDGEDLNLLQRTSSQLSYDDDTIQENSLHYVSGTRTKVLNPKAVPFDDDDLPFADSDSITSNETTNNSPPVQGAVGGEIETIPEQVNSGNIENCEQRNGRPVQRVPAQVHARPAERSLPLLTEQPNNNDQGRLAVGPRSFTNHLPNSGVPNGGIDSSDVSMPSTSFEPIRPDENSNQSSNQ